MLWEPRMILELHVENLAILEHASLPLGPGFTAITGETGAGKSLLVDAIGLALGERADSELVRAGTDRATVHAVIDVTDNAEGQRRCRELGATLDEGRLIVQREVFAEGRSQARIGGKPHPLASLRAICETVADLHGQHEHQTLLDPERHLDHLDQWIGGKAKQVRDDVARLYAEAEKLRSVLSHLRRGLREREQRLDLLRYQVAEIEDVAPIPGEMPELEAKLSRLRNVDRLAAAVEEAKAALDEGGLDALRKAAHLLETVAALDPQIDGPLGPLRASLYSAEDSALELGRYRDSIEADPAALQEVADRIDLLVRLRRKYGEDEAAVLAHLEEARAELDGLEDAEASEEEAAAALAEAEQSMMDAARTLSALRAAAAGEFAGEVGRHLQDLAMAGAQFEARISASAPGPTGIDRVEFFFSANQGEAPRPLDKIASGGEISRAMLAIKAASAGRAGVPTLIFDEVDVGLGGRAAASMAAKLEELARHYQVVVVSHLPQIASRAARHYRIDKGVEGGRTQAVIRELDQEGRVEELARMLAGERVGESARANAREMLL